MERVKRFMPVAQPNFVGDVAMGPGDSHTCGILSDGTVECLAANETGEAGDGTFLVRPDPVAVMTVAGATQVQTAGLSPFACALAGGHVWCWGINDSRQLGDGATVVHSSCVSGPSRYDCSNVPVEVAGITDATQIAVGGSHVCALFATGTVQCWGANYYGQLGTGDRMDSAVPVDVTGLTDAVEIAAGDGHTCARRMGGTVVCWGSNRRGEIGDGMMDGHSVCTFGATSIDCSSTPVAVTGVTGAAEITAGFKHTCARTTAGEVFCWGFNEFKQIGNGTVLDAFTPTQVTGL